MLQGRTFVCGHCGDLVFLERGYRIRQANDESSECGIVFICPSCDAAIYFSPDEGSQIPGSSSGKNARPVPPALQSLYSEAGNCAANGNYTSAVFVCQKLVMNIAVGQGAEHHLRFGECVAYLFNQGHVPLNARRWVDGLRQQGDEAEHEIVPRTGKDAREMIVLVTMLLQSIHGFPEFIPRQPPA